MVITVNKTSTKPVILSSESSYKITVATNVVIDFICIHDKDLDVLLEIGDGAVVNFYETFKEHSNRLLESSKEINVGNGVKLMIFELLNRYEKYENKIVQSNNSSVEVLQLCELKNDDEAKSVGEFIINGENCKFNQISRFLLHDSSSGFLESVVVANRDSTNAQISQAHNTLLIGKNSNMKVHSAPQMKIFHDELKAKHSSTVGSLDDEALFYMQSRAISKENAEEILQDAFKLELIERIDSQEFRKMLL